MKKVKLFFAVGVASAALSMTSFAGEWKQDASGWWYQNDDGSYPTNTWKEINGKQYYFDNNGYILTNTSTPDGQKVDASGALITPLLVLIQMMPKLLIPVGNLHLIMMAIVALYCIMILQIKNLNPRAHS